MVGGARPGEAAVLAEFLDLYAADGAAGVTRTLADYQQIFSGFEEAIARKHAEVAAPRDETGTDRPVRLGPYRLLHELGRGGQGIVWLAEDPRLGRQVALKVLLGLGQVAPGVFARFHREAEIASRLDHPGICSVYETGVEAGMAWIAMRHVEGESLARRIQTARERQPAHAPGAVALARHLAYFEKVARALHAAHEAGVIHRDVKPGNLMVRPDGEPVVLDFGLARETRGELPALTRTGAAFGTPAYMAPEQIEPRRGPVDRRADVWALGAALYEALTLRRPFEAPTAERLLHAILVQEPASPRSLNPAIGRDLEAVVLTALEKDLTRRYESMLDFAEDLRRILEREPVRARPAGPILRLRRFCERRPAIAASLAVALIGLGTGFVLSLVALADVRRERDAKSRALHAYEQLADAVVVAELLAESTTLWPRRPERLPSMRGWLARARDVRSRLELHRGSLAALPAGHSAPADRWRREVLSRLIGDLERLEVEIAGMEARERFADSIVEESLGRHRALWEACIADIAVNPRYRGLEIAPQTGLVPLGKDAASGLWEFWHLDGGARPSWEGTLAAGRARLDEASGLVLVLLPGGSFRMGAQAGDPLAPVYDPAARADEVPVDVTIDPFFLSKFEMTQAQWARATGSNPSTYSPDRALYGRHATLLHPVEQVDFAAAAECLGRLGLLLPTEAQWEYACRAETRSPWSTGIDRRSLEGAANLADASFAAAQAGAATIRIERWLDDGHAGHAPAGSFDPNAYGLHDMHGNVMEWCRDAHDLLPASPRPGDGLRGDEDGEIGVARGGSFFSGADVARSAARVAPRRANATLYLGVRPALSISGGAAEARSSR